MALRTTCAATHLYLLILLKCSLDYHKDYKIGRKKGNYEFLGKQSWEWIIIESFSKIAMQQQTAQPEREERQKKKSLGPWNVICPEEKSIKFACLQPKCYKSALHCDDTQCPHCYGLHSFCKKVSIDTFTQFLDQNYNRQSRLVQIAWQIEQEMIRTIQESHQTIKKQLHYNGLPNSIRSVLKSIFGSNNYKHFSGVDMESLQEQIRRFRPMGKEKLIYQHVIKARSAIQTYIDEKMEIVTSLEANQRIISKIITKQEEIDFVFEALGQPRKLQLLYRATENQFSAAKFHQKCDQIQHTLTIVKTEFDRVIAGYTPLKWSSPSTWTAFCDNSGRSFLMQIDLKQKIPLTEPLYAIYCHQTHGPRFGRSDLALPNKCNQNNCTGNFPASYNILGKYTNGQQSHLSFTGSPNGFYFRSIQYEVFRVIYNTSNL